MDEGHQLLYIVQGVSKRAFEIIYIYSEDVYGV
jgi:hypothetical protein